MSATDGIKIIKHDPLPESDDDLPATVKALVWLGRRSSSASNIGDYALVTSAADPDDFGFAVHLAADLSSAVDDEGHAIGPDDYGTWQFQFRNAQKNLGVPEDARIYLTSLYPVTAESLVEDTFATGFCVDPADALSTAPGDNPGGLFGGAGVKAVTWSGESC